MLANLWLTSENAQGEFSRPGLTLEEKLTHCHVAFHDLDMTDLGWVRVGQVNVEPIGLLADDDLRKSLIASFNAQIKQARLDCEARINYLEDRKQQLLCLEAPKP